MSWQVYALWLPRSVLGVPSHRLTSSDNKVYAFKGVCNALKTGSWSAQALTTTATPCAAIRLLVTSAIVSESYAPVACMHARKCILTGYITCVYTATCWQGCPEQQQPAKHGLGAIESVTYDLPAGFCRDHACTCSVSLVSANFYRQYTQASTYLQVDN